MQDGRRSCSCFQTKSIHSKAQQVHGKAAGYPPLLGALLPFPNLGSPASLSQKRAVSWFGVKHFSCWGKQPSVLPAMGSIAGRRRNEECIVSYSFNALLVLLKETHPIQGLPV